MIFFFSLSKICFIVFCRFRSHETQMSYLFFYIALLFCILFKNNFLVTTGFQKCDYAVSWYFFLYIS